MNRIAPGATALIILSAATAQAGALDRSGQPVTILFEEGTYVELSYSLTMPSIEGSFTSPLGTTGSGDVAESFGQTALSFKYDLTDRLSVALVLDQPFGVDLAYEDTDEGYPLNGTTASLSTSSITALARYRLGSAFSVHGGLRLVEIEADLVSNAFVPALGGVATYDAGYDADRDLGYVVGAAYEREAIGLRVALTYSSETEFQNDVSYEGILGAGDGTTNSYTLPQSVNLDFQTGIAAGTAIIGSVRWVDWSETRIETPGYFANPVVSYDGDYTTTTIGIGRAFSDSIRGSASLIYENEIGGPISDLSPYDGQLGVLVGGTYLVGNGLELIGGVRYALLGNATTQLGAEFEDNESMSIGLRAGYRF